MVRSCYRMLRTREANCDKEYADTKLTVDWLLYRYRSCEGLCWWRALCRFCYSSPPLAGVPAAAFHRLYQRIDPPSSNHSLATNNLVHKSVPARVNRPYPSPNVPAVHIQHSSEPRFSNFALNRALAILTRSVSIGFRSIIVLSVASCPISLAARPGQRAGHRGYVASTPTAVPTHPWSLPSPLSAQTPVTAVPASHE